MTRKRKILLAMAGVFVLSIAAVTLYLSVSDLSGWRDTVARLASKGMARELTIAGEFEVDFGIVTRVHATDITLANTEWGSESGMASLDRLDGEINLWALFSGSIHIPSVDIAGGRAIFESDVEAGSNWRLGAGDGTNDDSDSGGPVRLRIDRIQASDVTLIFGSTRNERHVDLVVDTLDSTGDSEGMHRLAGGGSIRGTDFTLSGQFGSFQELINLEPFEHDLRGTLASTEVQSAGTIGRIASLSDLEIKTKATITNPTEIYRFLGLDYTFPRPLTIRADTTTDSGLTNFTVSAEGEAANLSAGGSIDSLLSPENLDIQIELTGPDIRPVAALAGIDGLPDRPFSANGAFRWHGFPVVVDGLKIEVGENTLSADGALGAPPLMHDTDFTFQGEGPNIATVAAMAGLRFPPDSYSLQGRVFRVENGLQIEELSATIGRSALATDGFIGDPPGYTGTELSFEVSGPDLAHYRRTFGIKLPAESFRVKGRLSEGNDSITLHGVKATVGRATLETEGRLTTVEGLVGTDLTFVADGLDLLHIGDLLEFDDLPTSHLHAEGQVAVTVEGYQLQDVSCRIDDMDISAHGLITKKKHLSGTTLEIAADGNELSILDPLLPDLISLPREAFRIRGTLEFRRDDYGLEGIEVAIGGAEGTANGVIGKNEGLSGTDLQITVHGPSLAVADSLVPSLSLPDAEFSLAGRVTVHEGVIAFEHLTFGLADINASIDGSIAPNSGLIGTSVHASIEGSSLDRLGMMVGALISKDLPTLPAKPFSAAGDITIDETGHHLPALDLSLGDATASITGVVGRAPDFIGSDIEIRADGPDGSLIAMATGLAIPESPFNLTGRIAREEWGYQFHDVRARFGDHSAELDGRLGKLPKLIGTSLSVHAAGPDLELWRQLLEIESLPSQPFEVTGHFEGNPRRFKTNALDISLGSSDLSGTLRVDLEDKPRFLARLRSDRLKLDELSSESDQEIAEPDQPSPDESKEPSRLLVSDQHWDLGFLDVIDVDLNWDIGRLEYLLADDRDVELSLILEDGRLRVDRFHGTGSLDGVVDGSLILEPVASGHRLVGKLHVDDGMLNLAGDEADPSQYTPGDLHIELDATGRSLHEMLASADGRAVLTVNGGVLKKGIIDFISADVLVTLLDALNPFAKQDNYTNLNCAVLVATFDNGTMTLDPAAIQTDKVTVLGDGTIDFKTEKLRLDWITKPRKGIGISASMFTNPYIRLGGTLADPHLEMKPAEALATTGVAVATLGISLLAKGLYDRVTAEKKVCERAMKQIEEIRAEAPKK